MKKKIYWIKNDIQFSGRMQNFINNIIRFTNVEVIECVNLKNLKLKNSKKTDYLIFFQIVPAHYLGDLLAILKNPDLCKKIVVISVGDKPFYDHCIESEISKLIREFNCPIIDITGGREGHDSIAGYGFMHDLMGSIKDISVPFNERIPKFNFIGSIINNDRCLFLSKFKQLALTDFCLQKNEKDQHVPEILESDLKPKMDFYQYMQKMEQFKFSLVPMGHGHTFRFLESLAIGSLVISNDLSKIKFNQLYFKPGFNYISVRDDLKDVEEKIEMCLNNPEIETIAKRGNRTYFKYFSTNKGCLPINTVSNMLKELNKKIKKTFFEYNF